MLETIGLIFSEIISMFIEMAPYIILGLIFVALLNFFVSKDLISKHIGQNNFLSLFKAAIFGVPLPLCSCGVVPTAVYMAKNGASKGATVSFLISTPQTGIDSIIATYGMLGPLFAIFRPFAALIMGILGGISVKYFGDSQESYEKPKFIGLKQMIDKPISKLKTKKLSFDSIKQTMRYSFVEFVDDISVQFMAGVIIAGLIAYFIPDNYFGDSGISSGIVGMLIMIIIGVPMYVCATASIPIAMSLIMKGFSPGVAFVFLAVGPATNVATIAIISKSLGKRITVIYISAIALLSIIMGYFLDFIYYMTGDSGIFHNHIHTHESIFLTPEMSYVISVIFLLIIILSFYRKFVAKYFKNNDDIIEHQDMIKVEIKGMTCNHCVATVSETAMNITGLSRIEISLEENTAYIEGDFDMDKFKTEIENVGYKVVNVKQ
ncbi:MAG: SO_0444 family Cu/Zn efflux transporter [Candidatus Kapaibacterium sp.]